MKTIIKLIVLVIIGILVFTLFNCDNGFIDKIDEDTGTKYPFIELWTGLDKLDISDEFSATATQEYTSSDYGFLIKNTGEEDLVLTNPSRVVLNDPDSAFSIVPPLPGTPITAGGTESFTIRFTPPGTGIYSATVTVENNTTDISSYNFTITGTGTATPLMGVPSNVAATDGNSINDTTITWDSVVDASVYYIYRNTSNTIPSSETYTVFSGSEEKIDGGGTPGLKYYYWVKAWNNTLGLGEESDSDSGYRKLASPTVISASSGTSTTHIVLQWSSAIYGGATSYEIYRYTSNIRPLESVSATFSDILSTATSYNDDSAVPATVYYYWIRAAASSSDSLSDWSSSSVDGYQMISAPANVAVSADCWAVDVSWDSVEGSTNYEIFSSLTEAGSIGTEYLKVGETSETSFSVSGFHYPSSPDWMSAGTPHYYKVRAYNPITGNSQESNASDPMDAWVCG